MGREIINSKTGRLAAVWAIHRTLEQSNRALEDDLAEGTVSWGCVWQVKRDGRWLTLVEG